MTNYISYGPAARDAIEFINLKILSHLPVAPENLKNAFAADNAFWFENLDRLTERFNVWIGE